MTLWDNLGFKPCYKWNTFNTLLYISFEILYLNVLNLVISGIPSIQHREGEQQVLELLKF